MQITNAFMKNLKVNTDMGLISATKTNTKESFENYMNDASSKDKAVDNKRPNERKRPDRTNKSSDSNKKEIKKKSSTEEKVSKPEIENSEESAVKKIADELEIPKEVVAEILGRLNLTALDLADVENLNAFLQEVYKVDSPAELLNISNISKLMTNIKDIAEKIAPLSHNDVKTEANAEAEITVETPIVQEAAVAATEQAVSVEPTDKKAKSAEVVETEETVEAVETEAPVEITKAAHSENFGRNQGHQQKGEGGQATFNFNLEGTQTSAVNGMQSNPIKSSAVQSTDFRAVMSAKNVNPQDIMQQLTENLKVNVKESVSEVKILLKPEQLGDITLKVMTENGIITAKFIAENEKIKEIIESNFNHLKETLQQQGINVSELSVSVGQDDTSDRMRRFMSEQRKSSARVKQLINDIAAEFADEAEAVQTILPDSNINFTA